MPRTALLLLAIALGAGVVAWRVTRDPVEPRGASVDAARMEARAKAVLQAVDAEPSVRRAQVAPTELAAAEQRVSERVIGRLVDADGLVVPPQSAKLALTPADVALTFPDVFARLNAYLEHRAAPSGPTDPYSVFVTDGGRFELELPARLVGVTGRALELKNVNDVDGNRANIRVLLPDALTPGVHDLGELRLPAAPFLVAGFVVDASGAAVFDAEVEIAVTRTGSTREEKRRTDARGRFRATGDASDIVALHVGAKLKSSSSGARTAVALGTSDVVLTLRRKGSLHGHILHPAAGSIPANLRFTLMPVDPPGESVSVLPKRSGEVRALGLVPGAYTFVVTLGSEGEPLRTFEHVVIREGEAVRPAWLDPLDLRGVLREVHVRVSAPDRRAVVADVFYRAAGDDAAPWNTVELIASGTLLTAAPALDLRVEAAGYHPLEARDVAVRADLVLEPAYRIYVKLGSPVVPGCRYALELVDSESGASLGRAELGAPQRIKEPSASLTLLRPGAVLARLSIDCTGELDKPVLVLERRLVVADDHGAQAFTLDVADDERRAGLREPR